MTKGRLQRVSDHYRTALRNHERQAEQALEDAYRSVLKTLDPALDRLYQQMADKLAEGDKIPAHWIYEAGRLESIKKLIQHQIDHFGQLSHAQVLAAQHYAVQLGQQSAMEMLHATVPPGFSYNFGIPSTRAIQELVGVTQAGSPLADLFDGFGREAAQKAGEALITGVTLGRNPREVARDVQQALGTSRNRALTISRTEMLRSYRQSSLETMRANSDVCKQWRWVADKSIRTCSMCLAMDGTLHDLEEDLDSHPNCRCVASPIAASWEDILSPLGIDTSNIPETGQYDYQSGADWFDQQSVATQKQILGNAKYAAYQAGDIALSDLVYHGHDDDWGGYRQEKSLKDAIGAKKAAKYYGK